MCIIVDENSMDRIKNLQEKVEAIEGYSVKMEAAGINKTDKIISLCRSLCRNHVWEKGLNKSSYDEDMHSIYRWLSEENLGFHFFFNLAQAKTLKTLEQIGRHALDQKRLCIIKCSIKTKDILCLGIVDQMGEMNGNHCFTAKEATWDGKFIT